ncbi:oxygenase MpaB family protein [Saccharopolyspora shandongensis]|uniref:oxygenase MpaB family protein n=1 Tax=Saccharopolyspora shandongensis TaxID=418495 RepID=UPI0033E21D57
MEISGTTLDELARIGDPKAEQVVSELVEKGQLEEVNRVLSQWHSYDQDIPAGLPRGLHDFLQEARVAPEWADQERLTRVHEFFEDDGIHIGTVLALGSMAMAYAVPLGAKMMSLTHRLRYPERRMANTAQFVFDLMQPDPFGPNSRFVVSAVKVRLIHATVRHHLRATGSWDEDRHGVPASQEHLLIVWLALSVQVLDFLERLRIRVTAQEAEDYMHTWRVAGTFLGIPAAAMPSTASEARQLFATALARSAGPSEEGTELTGHLIDLYSGVLPGKVFDGVVPALLRRLIGKDVANLLKVPHSPLWQVVVRAYVAVLGGLERIEDRSRLGKWWLDRLGKAQYALELRILTRGKSKPLALPTQLAGYNEEITVPTPRSAEKLEHAGDVEIVPLLAVDRQMAQGAEARQAEAAGVPQESHQSQFPPPRG